MDVGLVRTECRIDNQKYREKKCIEKMSRKRGELYIYEEDASLPKYK